MWRKVKKMAVDPSKLKKRGRKTLGVPPTDGSPGIETDLDSPLGEQTDLSASSQDVELGELTTQREDTKDVLSSGNSDLSIPSRELIDPSAFMQDDRKKFRLQPDVGSQTAENSEGS